MNGLEFTSSVIGSLAWPVAVVVLVALFKKQILKVLDDPGSLKRLKAGPLELEYFDKTLDEVRETLQKEDSAEGSEYPPDPTEEESVDLEFMSEMALLADLSPRSVVLESSARLEMELRELVRSKREDFRGRLKFGSILQVARLARETDLISENDLFVLQDLSRLRNAIAHDSTVQIEKMQALAFADLADQTAKAIRRRNV